MKSVPHVNRALASLLAAVGVGAPLVAPLPAGGQPAPRRAAPSPGQGESATPVDAATLVAVYGVDEEVARQVAADLVVRAGLGFSIEPQLVIDLRTGQQEMAADVPEIAMTVAEADEYLVRQSLVEDAQILDEGLRAGELADVYGGQFIDHEGGVLVVQAATEAGAERVQEALDGELGRSLPHRERIEVRRVEVSRRDLVTAQEVVTARADAQGEGSAVTGAIIQDSTNEVVLFVAPGTPADEVSGWDAVLREQGVPYRIEERARLEPVDGTLRSDSEVPPYSGGHGFVGTSSTQNPPPSGVDGQYCTLGFKTNWSANPGGSYVLSAGHCWYGDGWQAPIDAKAYYNWNNENGGSRTGIGSVEGYQVTGNFDFSLIAIASDTAPKIIVNAAANNVYRGITAVTQYAPEGTGVCHVGAQSDSAPCGTVTDWDDGWHEIITDINGIIGGDSGGPLYIIRSNLKAWATGITAGSDGSNTRSSNIHRYLHSFCGGCNVDVE